MYNHYKVIAPAGVIVRKAPVDDTTSEDVLPEGTQFKGRLTEDEKFIELLQGGFVTSSEFAVEQVYLAAKDEESEQELEYG